jgi:hypothetical protein
MDDIHLLASNVESAARELLLCACPPFRCPGTWSFVPVHGELHRPVTTPVRLANELRGCFADDVLFRAGIIEANGPDGVRLASSLRHRAGAIVPLRKEPGTPPFELLTAKGLLGDDRRPLLSALCDERTRRRAAESGVLLATGTILQVAILIAIGLPATLGSGLHRLSLDELRTVDETFGEGLPQIDPRPANGVEEGQPSDDLDPPPRPLVVLVDWDVAGLQSKSQAWVRHAAVRLEEVRRHAGLTLGGVRIWHPSAEDLDHLRFAIRSEDVNLVRDVFLNSADGAVDFECRLADVRIASTSPETDRRSAADRLGARPLDPLWRDALDPESDARERASATEQELLVPLRDYALTRPNPIVRNTVALLAEVVHLLYLLGPHVHDTLRQSLTSADLSESSRVTLSQYLNLIDRFGRLCEEVRSWTR